MYNDLPEQKYLISEFNERAGHLFHRTPDRRDFIRFVLTGEVPDNHQAVVNPLLNHLEPGHPISISRDYDSIIGITEDIVVDCAVNIYPIGHPSDAITSHINLNCIATDTEVSTPISLV